MSGPLATIYSQSELLKKRLRDLLANPINYTQAAADRLREDTQDPMFAANFLTGSPGAFAGVIKPKGGNWLSGSVEDALRGLKKEGFTREQLVAMRDARLGKQTNGLNAYGEPLEDVDLIQELRARPEYRNLPPSYAQQAMLSAPQASINSWIEGPLTKYVKTRMASPDDEVRKLAEQGVLHFEPATIRERSPLMEKIVGRRETAGFPIQGVADAPLARNWENTADSLIRNLEARDISSAERAASFGGKSNIPGDTIVHEMNPFASGAGISDSGFPHLIDEISNALNPTSGLPRGLQLTPEAMQKLSMEKAVRHVHEINQFRKAAMEQARLKELETSGMLGTTRREYAENNPMGLRWVEYTRPEKLHEGVTNIAKHGDEYVALGADGQPIAQRLPDGSTGRLATGKTPEDAHLAGQLITEGNLMGHCVGGYCEDVASGRSRIFSLRDAKGEPHVTVEVQLPHGFNDLEGLPEYENGIFEDIAHSRVQERYPDLDPKSDKYNNLVADEADNVAQEWIANNKPNPSIVQIKGKQNRKPNDEYLPFVQDFVRNSPLGQPWSHVGDIQHTDLVTIPKGKTVTMDGRRVTLPEGYQSLESLRNLLSHPDTHPELSDAQAEALYNEYLRGNNYAEGGSIRSTPSIIDLIRNDPELQALPKNILKSLLNFGRGSVAALGGIGGDMTALGGTLLGNEVTGHGDTFLPTTSDLLRRLPQLPDDWKDYEVQQAGTFDPGIVPTALPKLGGAAARLGAEAIQQGMHGAGPLRDILRAAAPLHAIPVNRGEDAAANWLRNNVTTDQLSAITGEAKARRIPLEDYLKQFLPTMYDQFATTWHPKASGGSVSQNSLSVADLGRIIEQLQQGA